MSWHIAQKEIHYNLMTLRFALMIILLPALMVANALIYGYGDGRYSARLNAYNKQVAERLSRIERHAAKGIGQLAMVGPGEILRHPSRLLFCADGDDELIPHQVTMKSHGTQSRSGGLEIESYAWRDVWALEYPFWSQGSSETIKIDWVFIGILMSFLAILFTFDAIAGEKERGTLSLMMSNTVSRGQVLLGKYVGAFLTLMVPLAVGILINLLVIHLSGSISFDSSDWLSILGMVGLFALHVSIFIFLGLFFSSRVSNAITSLVWLLLSWVCLAFVFPPLLSTFVTNLHPIPSINEVSLRKQARLDSIEDDFRPTVFDSSNKLKHAPAIENPEATRQWAAYFSSIRETKTSFADRHLDQQLRQVQFAREIIQISPIVCFQNAMEGLANTGIEGYSNFVKQARRYRQTFMDFIRSEDRGDPESLHIYFVKEGLSQKPVSPDAVPAFKEQPWNRNVLFQTGLLILFNLLFFMLAETSFLKSDVK